MDVVVIGMALIVILLMLGLGASVDIASLRKHLRSPWPVCVGFISQFLVMPFVAWSLAMLFLSGLDSYALGLLFVGCMPGGATSNLFCYYAGGDVGLSIMMTTCSSLAAFFMVPLVLWIYSPSFTSNELSIDYAGIMKSLLLVLVPSAMGFTTRNWEDLRGAITKQGICSDKRATETVTSHIPIHTEMDPTVVGNDKAAEVRDPEVQDSRLAGSGKGINSPNTAEDKGLDQDQQKATNGLENVVAVSEKADNPANPVHLRIAKFLERLASSAGLGFIVVVMVVSAIKYHHVLEDPNIGPLLLTSTLLMPLGALFGFAMGAVVIIAMQARAKMKEKVTDGTGGSTAGLDATQATDIAGDSSTICDRSSVASVEGKEKVQNARTIKAICLETGVQNTTLAVAMIATSWDEGVLRDEIMAIPLLYTMIMVLQAAVLALVMRKLG